MRRGADMQPPAGPSLVRPAIPPSEAVTEKARVPVAAGRGQTSRRKRLVLGVILFLLVLTVAAVWRFSALHEMTDTQAIAQWLHGLRRNPWAPVLVVLIYVGANAVFFPNTVLNAATILGLGTTVGLPCALTGSLVSAMVAYGLGRRFGKKPLRRLDSAAIERLGRMFQRSGVLGVAMLRLVPVAPYGAVNLVAGAARVRVFPFAMGTLLGLLPGNLLMTAFGHQLRAVLRNPSKAQIAIMVGVILLAAAGAWWARGKAMATA